MKLENIKELVDSFTEDEFGAVSAILNVLNDSMNNSDLYTTLCMVNDALHERADSDLNGDTSKD
jgi:hypothetical protein